MSEINLLFGQDIILSHERVLRARVTAGVVAATVVTVAVLAAGLLVRQITANQVGALEASYKKGQNDFSSQQEKTASLWNVEAKAKGIAEVKQVRIDLVSQASGLVDLVSNGLTMDKASLERGGQTTAVLRTNSISSFDSLLSKTGTFSGVVISGLNIGQDGTVSLTFSGKYGK